MRKTAVDVVGVPSDLGAPVRGANMAPLALRNLGLYDAVRYAVGDVRDLGDVVVPLRDPPSQPNSDGFSYAYLHHLAELCRAAVMASRLPVVIGGDHSLSFGSVKGVMAGAGQRGDSWGLLWIDAHLDAHLKSTSLSGCAHGMVLAHIIEELGDSSSLLDGVVVLGVRSVDFGERDYIKSRGLQVYTMSEIRSRSIEKVLAEVQSTLAKKVKRLYVSWDLDSLDPSVVPGVSTPVWGGLSLEEALKVAEWVGSSSQLGALDLVEWNPLLDEDFRSGEVALELIRAMLGARRL